MRISDFPLQTFRAVQKKIYIWSYHFGVHFALFWTVHSICDRGSGGRGRESAVDGEHGCYELTPFMRIDL